MNYITLINNFWALNREHSFTANETAVYFAMLDICNDLRWKNPFNQSNSRFCSKLGISEPTFSRARNVLKQKGLIDYKSAVGRRNNSLYEIKYQKNFGISEGISEGIVGGIYEGISEGIYSENSFDNNKHKQNKNETKIDDLKKPRPEFLKFNFKEGKERKKSCAEKKKEIMSELEYDVDVGLKLEVIEHQSCLETVWLDFYKDKFGFNPTFRSEHRDVLVRILFGLKMRTENSGEAWIKESSEKSLHAFLVKAYADGWLKAHFLLSNLDQQFDKILNDAKPPNNSREAPNAAPANRGKGGSISEMQSLKRGGSSNSTQPEKLSDVEKSG